jgi:hypothetical protein
MDEEMKHQIGKEEVNTEANKNKETKNPVLSPKNSHFMK